MNTLVEKQLAKEPNKKIQYATIALIVVGMFIWSLTAIKINKTSTDGSQVALNILKGIVTPDLNFLFDFSNTGVAYLLFETICIGFLGTILGSIFSIPIAFFNVTKYYAKTSLCNYAFFSCHYSDSAGISLWTNVRAGNWNRSFCWGDDNVCDLNWDGFAFICGCD